MIIVSGRIYVRAGRRSQFLDQSMAAMQQARQARGCLDFVVAADPIETDRVNIYEEWTDREALEAFRDSGPPDELTALIVKAAVAEHEVEA